MRPFKLSANVDKIPIQLGDLWVMLVYGSPRRINEYLHEDRPESSLERLLDLAEADVLVCGHPISRTYWINSLTSA